jgi:4-hydroxybenzoate polyprenyltransferase
LLIGLTLCIPIKDFKDLEGDKKNNIWTIPAIFGEEKARVIVAVNFFISYMLSVFFLGEFRLFWWALLFGGIAFFVIQNRNIKAWKLIWWNLGIVSIYSLVLVKIIFLQLI